MADKMTGPAETRLEALDRYRILDTPAEQGFDDIVLLASRLCETPIALVSLVTEDRQWFKARIGFTCSETPLDDSICAFALQQNETFVIPDLTVDERTKHNPLVTDAPFFGSTPAPYSRRPAASRSGRSASSTPSHAQAD